MEPEDEQEAEATWIAQTPFVNIDSTNVKQDAKQEVAAWSWVRRTGRRCKEYFSQRKPCWRCVLWGFLLVLLFTIVCVLITLVSHHGKFPPEQCPSEWIGYKKKCYFISEGEENWTSSQTFCAENESLLAVFENQEEMIYCLLSIVNEFHQKHSLAKYLKIDDSWIGLRKKGKNFYWENGIPFKEDSFQIQNHSECAYLDAFTISTSACSLPRRCLCFQLPKRMT